MDWIGLDVEIVLTLHQDVIEAFGGRLGLLNLDALEAAVGRLYTTYDTTLQAVAAGLMESLCNNHAFVDGNKRVAYFGTLLFLNYNGYTLKTNGKEANTYIRGLMASHNLTKAILTAWIIANMEPLQSA
jgi:death on curing protein